MTGTGSVPRPRGVGYGGELGWGAPCVDKGPPAADLYRGRDHGAFPDACPDTGSACTAGDKRCDGLFKIERCPGGAWVPHEDCSQKKVGGQSRTCSMTLLFVYAVGGSECT